MATPSVTGQIVFDNAMSLVDSINESTGSSDIADNAAYKLRAVALINMIASQLYPYSDNYVITTASVRPIFPKITTLADIVLLDDYIAESIIPYGLAAQLLMDENPTLANNCQQYFAEAVAFLRRGFPSVSEAITDYYDVGTEHNEFSAW